MKNKIKEAQQELKEEIDRNQYLKKNSKYTKFQELQLENMILNQQNDKMSLLIQNSNELKNKQNSELNQKIIKDHSQGTTILHASKAIPFLETAVIGDVETERLNFFFKQIVTNKTKLGLLIKEKQLLLSKYF